MNYLVFQDSRVNRIEEQMQFEEVNVERQRMYAYHKVRWTFSDELCCQLNNDND